MASADILRAAHSPLPFEASRESIFAGEANIAICDVWDATSEIDDANAAFIVRACNAHYGLLDAAKGLRQHLALFCGPDDAIAQEVFRIADAAIAAAEAEAGR